jgi:hypothetical protein
MLRRVALARTDFLQKHIASIIRVTRIGELRTTLAVTSNRSTMRRCHVPLVGKDFPPKRRFLQQPHGVTSQETPLFIVTAVKTSELTQIFSYFREAFWNL